MSTNMWFRPDAGHQLKYGDGKQAVLLNIVLVGV
jgi:hypothetical protein